MGLRKFGKMLFPDAIEADDNYTQDIYDDVDDQYQEDERNVRSSDSSYGSRGIGVSTGGSSIEMKVVTPKNYDTVTQIADLLLSKKTVLLNLESTNRETARRLIDFLSGVAYALGGGVQKVADNTYAITPSNVAVSKENIGGAAVTATPETENTTAF